MGKNAEKKSKFRCSSGKNGEFRGTNRLFRFEFENRKPHIYFNVEGSTVLNTEGNRE